MRAGSEAGARGEPCAEKPAHISRVSPQENVRALTRGVQAVMGYKPGSGPLTAAAVSAENVTGKPWKKHGNRNKKEKSRRLYKHLDM